MWLRNEKLCVGRRVHSFLFSVDSVFPADVMVRRDGGALTMLAQIAETVKTFEAEMMAKRDEMQQAEEQAFSLQAEGNLKEGQAFLAENGTKEGVVTTASGLQYKVISAGSGAKPTVDSTVEVHYAGRLLDGTEFDSSVKRGVPATFGVTQVIAGWTEALQLMPQGSKWELYIPADLAYGPGGTGPIGPNQMLIFEVELLNANVSAD